MEVSPPHLPSRSLVSDLNLPEASTMADYEARLLPPRSIERSIMQGTSWRPSFQGRGTLSLKKRGQGIRSWLRIDTKGDSQVLEMDKSTIMRRCNLPARDLRLLDPLFVYPSTILGREKAIVVNLEQIRCIITADEVLLLNSLDSYVLQYSHELRRRLVAGPTTQDLRWLSPDGQPPLSHSFEARKNRAASDSDMFNSISPAADNLPFEFRALEVALEAACTFLDTQATELEAEAYPVLDELTLKISTLNLEHVRRLKSRLVVMTRRVQKVRDEIEQLMDDDGDMAEMYLTKKREHMEMAFQRDQSLFSYASFGAGVSVSVPVSPITSPVESRKLERTSSIVKSRHSSARSYDDGDDDAHVEELEMLLEAYFVVIDGTLNKLTSLKEYIDDTEDFINIQLDNVRNQLIQFELLLTTATFVMTIYSVVAGVFGMNIPIDLYDDPSAFKWVIILTGLSGFMIFCVFMWFLKRKGLVLL